MKTSITLILIALCFHATAQSPAGWVAMQYEAGEGFAMRQVLDLPGQSAQQIYEKALRWVHSAYLEPDEAIDSRIEGEQIRGRGVNAKAIEIYAGVRYDATYSWHIQIRDGALRYSMYKLVAWDPLAQYTAERNLLGDGGQLKTTKQATRIKQQWETIFNSNLENLKNYLQDQATLSDW